MKRLRQLAGDTFRRDRRRSFFIVVAVALLGLGSGASLLVASLYDQLVLRQLPVAHPEQLLLIQRTNVTTAGEQSKSGRFSLEECRDLRRGAEAQLDFACFESGAAVAAFGAGTERVPTEWVTPNYFTMLGLDPAVGRLFSAAADRGAEPFVVLSYAAWQRRFGGSAAVVGAFLSVEGRRAVIVGVAPRAFRSLDGGSAPELFALATPADGEVYRAAGRLRPDATPIQAQTILRALEAELLRAQPGRVSFSMVNGQLLRATERLDVVTGERGDTASTEALGPILLLVGGLVGVVLLILCVNLANLLAARAADQRRQAAIRRALGATPWGLAAAWVGESLFIGLAGSACGLLLARFLGAPLLSAFPDLGLGAGPTFSIDGRVAAVALVLSLLTAALVGGLAAWESARVSLSALLSGEGRSTTRGGAPWRWLLVAVQVGLSLVLLVVMGLLARSLHTLLTLDPGLPLDKVLAIRADLPAGETRPPSQVWSALLRDAEALPGASFVGYATAPILEGSQMYRSFAVEGFTPAAGETMLLDTVDVSPGFFEALGIAPLRGRTYTTADALGPARGLVVNQRFVDRYLPHVDPLGRHVAQSMGRTDWSHREAGDLEIVGVVTDRQLADVRQALAPRAYSLPRPDARTVVFYLRSSVPPTTLAASFRSLIRRSVPEVALGEMRTLRRQRDLLLGRERIVGYLVEGIGLVGTLIAALGLYGVTRLAVGQQLREIALRLALGASSGRIASFVLHGAVRALGLGLLAGAACAAPATRLLANFLYGTAPDDPRVFAMALGALAFVGLLACWAPVRYALRTDPATVLKHE